MVPVVIFAQAMQQMLRMWTGNWLKVCHGPCGKNTIFSKLKGSKQQEITDFNADLVYMYVIGKTDWFA